MCVTAQIAAAPLPDNASLPVSFSYRDLRLWKVETEAAGGITVVYQEKHHDKII
jgi:hypothetical protein